VTISDTGSGIPRHLLPDLFTAFRSTSEAGTGSGLGLAFCKLAVESSGGSIRAVSPPGVGASFVMRFPIASPAGSTPNKGLGLLSALGRN
jgi:signal transduction histidine kinase